MPWVFLNQLSISGLLPQKFRGHGLALFNRTRRVFQKENNLAVYLADDHCPALRSGDRQILSSPEHTAQARPKYNVNGSIIT